MRIGAVGTLFLHAFARGIYVTASRTRRYSKCPVAFFEQFPDKLSLVISRLPARMILIACDISSGRMMCLSKSEFDETVSPSS